MQELHSTAGTFYIEYGTERNQGQQSCLKDNYLTSWLWYQRSQGPNLFPAKVNGKGGPDFTGNKRRLGTRKLPPKMTQPAPVPFELQKSTGTASQGLELNIITSSLL